MRALGSEFLVNEVDTSRSLIATTRTPPRPAIEPFQQGDLDGLCGVYAIINALRLLHPSLDRDAAHALFRKLIKTLGKTFRNPTKPVYDGICPTVLEDLLITARQQVRRHHSLEIVVKPLVLWRKRPTLADVWDAFREQLNGEQVAILVLSGVFEHWTVAYAASETTIRLFDSADRKVITRSRATLQITSTRHRLHPRSVLLIKRRL
jgi:hypothetical protein